MSFRSYLFVVDLGRTGIDRRTGERWSDELSVYDCV